MIKAFEAFDRRITLKKKGNISVICAAAAVLWAILAKSFSMEFYSLFFASAVGSNLLLVMMSAVISVPCNFLFSKFTGNNISLSFSLISDLILMTAAAYAFSIFRYTSPLIFAAAELMHFAAVILLTGFPREDADVEIPYIKRKTLPVFGFSAAHTVLSDGVFLFLVYALAKSFI